MGIENGEGEQKAVLEWRAKWEGRGEKWGGRSRNGGGLKMGRGPPGLERGGEG